MIPGWHYVDNNYSIFLVKFSSCLALSVAASWFATYVISRCCLRAYCAQALTGCVCVCAALMRLSFPGGGNFDRSIGKNTVVGGRALKTYKGGDRMLRLGCG